jgi:hypothetical protein
MQPVLSGTRGEVERSGRLTQRRQDGVWDGHDRRSSRRTRGHERV